MKNKLIEEAIACSLLAVFLFIIGFVFLNIALPKELERQEAVHDYNCQHFADYAKRFCGE